MWIQSIEGDGQGKPNALTCSHGDGTNTYLCLTPIFALHDLFHALETTEDVFRGLIARGRGLDRSAEKDAATEILANTLPATALVAGNRASHLPLMETSSESLAPTANNWDGIAAVRDRYAERGQQREHPPTGDATESHLLSPESCGDGA